MPWQEQDRVSLRAEVVALLARGDVPVTEIARRYGISRKTIYKWVARAGADGTGCLDDQSRRPHRSPRQTPDDLVARILVARQETGWGARKLHHYLVRQGLVDVPAPSTITSILRRHGGDDAVTGLGPGPRWARFTAPGPNALWQMDFKGPVAIQRGTVYPLLVLDDYSRFLVSVTVEPNQQFATVRATLELVFRRYGLPARILSDNGPPWGRVHAGAGRPLTRLTAWFVRLGIAPTHGRPYHPQTQGKVERCMRTLGAEALQQTAQVDAPTLRSQLTAWRDRYNQHRPHDALAYTCPSQHYTLSPRPFPEDLPPLVYEPDDRVCRVTAQGFILLGGQRHYVSEAIPRELVAVRPTAEDGIHTVWYGGHELRTIDEAQPRPTEPV